MDQFDLEIERANRRAQGRLALEPRAASARYDREGDRIQLELSNGFVLFFPTKILQGIAHAAPQKLDEIEISPSGFGLHFPKLDADVWLPGLLEGAFGSRSWMAALGAQGGKVRSAAKIAAARENGKLGGRPKKKLTPISLRALRGVQQVATASAGKRKLKRRKRPAPSRKPVERRA